MKYQISHTRKNNDGSTWTATYITSLNEQVKKEIGKAKMLILSQKGRVTVKNSNGDLYFIKKV